MGISAADIYWDAVCYPEIPYLFLFRPISSYPVLSLPISSYSALSLPIPSHLASNYDALFNILIPKLLWREAPQPLEDTVEIRDIVKATFIGYVGNAVGRLVNKQSRHGTHADIVQTIDKVTTRAYLDKARERRGAHVDQRSHILERYMLVVVLLKVLHNELHTS